MIKFVSGISSNVKCEVNMLGKRVAEAMSGLINAHLVQLSCPGFESKKRKNIFLLKCVD